MGLDYKRVWKGVDVMKYRVSFYQDNEYEVMELISSTRTPDGYYNTEESVFKGSLSDCEAYIRLKEQGYM